jgi:hypothetical protein
MTDKAMTDKAKAAEALPRWPVRLVDVPAGGVHVVKRDLKPADLAAFAGVVGVESMATLDLDLHVKPYRGDGLAVEGRVRATIGQTCVVTLDPVENEIDEEIEATFRPEVALKPHLVHDEEEGLAIDASVASDDPLVGGAIDAAAIAVEFLVLGIDPHPRKPGVAFEAPDGTGASSAFAGLAKLKRDR